MQLSLLLPDPLTEPLADPRQSFTVEHIEDASASKSGSYILTDPRQSFAVEHIEDASASKSGSYGDAVSRRICFF